MHRLPYLILIIAAVWAALQLRGIWPPDLSAIYFAARSYGLDHLDHVYTAPDGFFGQPVDDPIWLNMATEMGHENALILPYVYPPLTAIILSPLAVWLTPTQFFTGALMVNLGLTGWSILLAARIARASNITIWVGVSVILAITTYPFVFAHFQHQPHIWVTFLILLSFERDQAGHPGWAGVILAIAAAIKLTPLYFALIFLADRNWIALGTGVATSVALALLSLALGGWDLHLMFIEQIQKIGQADLILSNATYGLQPAMVQIINWGELAHGLGREFIQVPRSLGLSLVSALMMGPVMFVLLWITRDAAGGIFLRLLGLWLILVLSDPLSWALYAIGPLMLIPGFLFHQRLNRPAAIMLISGTGIFMSFQLFQTDLATAAIPFAFNIFGTLVLLVLLGAAFRSALRG